MRRVLSRNQGKAEAAHNHYKLYYDRGLVSSGTMGVAKVDQSPISIARRPWQKQAQSKVLRAIQCGRADWHHRVQITIASRSQDSQRFSRRVAESLPR
jgi:hypothetical protein